MTRKPWRTILILLVAAACFAVAFLISINEVFDSGNVVGWALAGAFLFVAAHLSEQLP